MWKFDTWKLCRDYKTDKYSWNLVLITATMEKLQEQFHRYKCVFESKGMKVRLVKVSSRKIGQIKKDVIQQEDLCGEKRMANAVLHKSCRHMDDWQRLKE